MTVYEEVKAMNEKTPNGDLKRFLDAFELMVKTLKYCAEHGSPAAKKALRRLGEGYETYPD